MRGRRKIPNIIDVLIVGAGPAGLAAALHLSSKKRLKIVLVDSRTTIGRPIRCGETTGDNYFKVLGIKPRDHWIRQKLAETPGLFVVNRELSELQISHVVAQRGVFVAPETSVVSVGEFDGDGRGVTLASRAGERQVYARCLMAADGVSSSVARSAGVDTYLPPKKIVSSMAYRIVDAELKSPEKAHIEQLPLPFPPYPYYFWVIPNGAGEANVGLYIPSMDGHKARPLLDRLLSETDAIQGGRIVQTVVGMIPDTPPLKKPHANGLLVLGTAARFIDPLSAGGIGPAAQCGRAAAKAYWNTINATIPEALPWEYDRQIASLQEYFKQQWKLRRQMETGYARGQPLDFSYGRKWALNLTDPDDEKTVLDQ